MKFRHPEVFIRYYLKRLHKISTDKYFVLILSLFVGIISGIIAFLLRSGVFYLRDFLIGNEDFGSNNLLFIIYPGIGITLTVLFTRYLLRKKDKHDISAILYSVAKKNSLLPKHKMFSSAAGAMLTAGFGGSVGLESPIISSGAALGSNLGRYLRLDYKTVTLLLACGTSGAIAAIFNTPIAAFIFALEVLLIDLTRFSLIPLLIASIGGSVTSMALYSPEVLFDFSIQKQFELSDLPFYIVLGFGAGILSGYFSRVYLFIAARFEKIKRSVYKLIIGSVLTGALLFLFPSLFGEGFETVKNILSGDYSKELDNTILFKFSDDFWFILIFYFLLIIFKAVATGITTAAGGIGGIFAPSLFTGAVFGFLFAHSINACNIGVELSEQSFAMVGMAAMLSGVLHAPLTGIFLIAEVTSGYELFMPLMIVTTISFITVKAFSAESVFTAQLSEQGALITHHKDKAVLRFMHLDKLIETNFTAVHPDDSLRNITKSVSKSKRNIFPVTDANENLRGIILLDDIREIMFDTAVYDKVLAHNLMIMPPAVISVHDNMETVVEKFNKSGAWNLPVVEDRRYLGFISKSKMYEAYRKQLVEISDD